MSVGDLVLHPEELDLRDVVDDVVSHIAREGRHDSTISIHAPEPARGRWDRLRLEQVVMNLLANAIEYGSGSPIDITVSGATATRGERVRLSVRDRGIGIAAAEQERIFERFERLTPLRYAVGFGIGLWIVREIVEAHGGNVTVSSRPGAGSELTVELPSRPGRDQSDEASTPAIPLQHEVHS